MKIRNIHFRDHIFSFILVPLVIVIVIISYYRFMVKHDYIVGYQGSCDPATGKCFKSCEDDACTKIDYYSEMQKYEPDLFRECGKDITNCEAANTCLTGDRKCSVTYCNKKTSDNNNVCQAPVETQSSTQTNPVSNTINTNL